MSSFKEISLKWYKYLLGIVAIAYNPKTWKAEAARTIVMLRKKKKMKTYNLLHRLIIPEVGRQRQEAPCEFEASLIYAVNSKQSEVHSKIGVRVG